MRPRSNSLKLTLVAVFLIVLALLSHFKTLSPDDMTPALAQANANAQMPPVAPKAAFFRPVLLTGEVVDTQAQLIVVPPSNSQPVILRNFVADGTQVKTGDLVLRIDVREGNSPEQLEVDMAQAREKTLHDVAKLEVAAIEEERKLLYAKFGLAKAQINAALPKSQMTLLDFDKNQSELDNARRNLAGMQKTFANATENIARQKRDGELALKKVQINYAFAKALLSGAQVHAQRDGFVVHNYGGRTGERFDEGGSARPGNVVGQIMGNGHVKVYAWALEADRSFLQEGKHVQLGFDALPDTSLTGTVTAIASAPEERTSWGQGRYFRVEIALPPAHGQPLVHGMSVMIAPLLGEAAAKSIVTGHAMPSSTASQTSKMPVIKLEGEIQSRLVSAISPPAIRNIFSYNLSAFAPEGSNVKAGQMVATFQNKEMADQLETSQSKLNEKQRALEKLRFDQADATKNTELTLAEAQSNAEKAKHKAALPKELVRRVDYDKWALERELTSQLADLVLRQRDAQNRAQKAEMNGLRAEIAQLQNDIDLLERGQKALVVKAKQDGIVLYRNDATGNKFGPGSEVFMGLSAANVADPSKLFVAATLPEAQSSSVRLGQAARVTVPGENIDLSATVTSLGKVFHGKSNSQSVVVRDLELQLTSIPKGLKPGTAVAVLLFPPPTRPGVTTPANGTADNALQWGK